MRKRLPQRRRCSQQPRSKHSASESCMYRDGVQNPVRISTSGAPVLSEEPAVTVRHNSKVIIHQVQRSRWLDRGRTSRTDTSVIHNQDVRLIYLTVQPEK